MCYNDLTLAKGILIGGALTQVGFMFGTHARRSIEDRAYDNLRVVTKKCDQISRKAYDAEKSINEFGRDRVYQLCMKEFMEYKTES